MDENNKKNILYVDDRDTWTSTVELLLEDETEYNLVTFNDLAEAKEYWKENSETLTLVSCDGSINETDDGRNWAAELHSAGFKAMILSTDGHGKVPLLEKVKFGKETLLSKMREVVGKEPKYPVHPAFETAVPGTEF